MDIAKNTLIQSIVRGARHNVRENDTLTPTFFIALMVARSISNPIQTAVAAAERVASGDLRADLSAEGQDETA